MKKTTGEPRARRSILWALIALTFKVAIIGVAIATPLLGAWVASSLAAYLNGPTGLVVVAGFGLCPILPVAWELFAWWRRSRRATVRPRFLHLFDRLVLRTLFINVLFLGGLVATHPESAFVALAARGDWMLDGRQDRFSIRAREILHLGANKLEWVYRGVHKNRFVDGSEKARPTPLPTPSPIVPTPSTTTATPAAQRWPMANTLHPLVTSIPPSSEKSIAEVGRYIAEHEPDPFLRVKALHDYVADRIAYDVPVLALPRVPLEAATAEPVFRARKGVCSGYADLLVHLGRAAGVEILEVDGDVRGRGGSIVDGIGHAWNAVRIEGRWYLMDPTWDAGTVNGEVFTKGYRTDYFLTPPEVFILDHLPTEPSHQLLPTPISRGDFIRQPTMHPAFFAQGLKLVTPDRSQVTVAGDLEIELTNPRGVFLMLSYGGGEGERATRCGKGSGGRVRCTLPGAGQYTVHLLTSPTEYGMFHHVGEFAVNRRD